MSDRILWNRPPKGNDPGDIDEIVFHNVMVHVEQMSDRNWWIAVYKDDGLWMGDFTSDSRGRMSFTESERMNLVLDDERAHGE